MMWDLGLLHLVQDKFTTGRRENESETGPRMLERLSFRLRNFTGTRAPFG